MLRMVDIEFIRKKHLVEGWSIRRISRNLDVSRQSVRKALATADEPRYRLNKPRPCPVIDAYRRIIEEWLKADQEAPAKQRHTAKRIYDRLVDEYGFAGAESTVRRFVRLLRARTPEVFVPLTADWGEQAQVDWGQAVVRMNGQDTVAHLFCLRLRASGVPFATAFPTEKLEAFLAGHRAAFEWLGGVPKQCVYDNPKTAVTRILSGPFREEHVVFSSLRAHYLFDSCFCNPAQGHEKGSVENLVGYVRRNALVPVMDFLGWEDLNAHLLRWCDKERSLRSELWQNESRCLLGLPPRPFHCSVARPAIVSRTSLVAFERNRYSVPCRWVGQALNVVATWDRVRVVAKGEVIAEHQRRYSRGETIVELKHYLPVLAQKPRASLNALVVRRLGGVWEKARVELLSKPDGYRELTAILMLHQDYRADEVACALQQAMELGVLNAGTVRQALLNMEQHIQPRIPVPERLKSFYITPPNLERYDRLVEVASS